jgi:hypothetical protein
VSVNVPFFFLRRNAAANPGRDARDRAVIRETWVSPPEPKPGELNWVSVRYDFKVNGQAYTGHRLTHQSLYHYRDRGDADALAARYPAKSQHSVAYYPTDPKRCMLEPGFGGFGWSTLWITPGLFLFSGVLAWLAWRERDVPELVDADIAESVADVLG